MWLHDDDTFLCSDPPRLRIYKSPTPGLLSTERRGIAAPSKKKTRIGGATATHNPIPTALVDIDVIERTSIVLVVHLDDLVKRTFYTNRRPSLHEIALPNRPPAVISAKAEYATDLVPFLSFSPSQRILFIPDT